MRKVITILSFCFLLFSCAPAAVIKPVHAVWPENNSKIEFVKSIYTSHDLGIKQNWLSAIFNFITGSNKEHEQFILPFAVAAKHGIIGITDIGAKDVWIFNARKGFFVIIDGVSHNGEAEPFSSPTGIAIGNNRIYVADSAWKRVFVLNYRGKLVKTIKSVLFSRPTYVGVAGNGDVYVADTLLNKILVFSKEGKLKFSFGSRGNTNGKFNFPTAIAISDNKVFVVDSLNFKVKIFSLNGKFIRSFGRHGDGSGDFARPKGIAVDSEGIIYITDQLFNVVQMFNNKGKYLMAFGTHGTKDGDFFMPSGIAVNGNTIYVADTYNSRVDLFKKINVK